MNDFKGARDQQCQRGCDEIDHRTMEMQRAGFSRVCESCWLDKLGSVSLIDGFLSNVFQINRSAINLVVDRMLGWKISLERICSDGVFARRKVSACRSKHHNGFYCHK